MEEYYNVLLKEQETQYDLMTAGVLVKASEWVTDAHLAAENGMLTLQAVCDMTDKLEAILASVAKLKKDINYTMSKIDEYKNSKSAAGQE